jgi:hypothetical protein
VFNVTAPPFRLRVKIGDMEVELGGDKKEVLSTLNELDGIMVKVTDAFNFIQGRPKSNPELHVESSPLKYPKIPRTTQCGEAVTALLSTEWGNIPRTISELREAMEANAIFFPKTTLSGVLIWLVKKGRIRRWKDKKKGYLYVINEPEAD